MRVAARVSGVAARVNTDTRVKRPRCRRCSAGRERHEPRTRPPTTGRRAAPPGWLARIATTQASHPKRTVFGGLLVFIIINFLAFGPLNGTLENKFVIPGSDAQKATDLLAAKFGARNGAVLQVVFDAQSGKLDTPERRAAISAALAQARARSSTRPRSRARSPTTTSGSRRPIRRIGYAEVQFSEDGFELKRAKIVELEDSMDATLAKAGINGRVHGRRRAGAA